MQRTTKPLTYVEVSGATVTPGSILTYTGGGSVIMNAVSTGLLLDPSGTNTIQSILAAYNSLVWGLYQSGMIITEPRIWFGNAGATGLLLSRVGDPLAIPYMPYSGAYSYISMNDALAALNGRLDPSGAQFRYAGGRVSLIVQDRTTIRFDEAVPAAYGSTRRMLNRLFLRDISGYIGVDLSGPLMIQGEPITESTYGVFTEPAPASNIQFINQTLNSFDITWSASPTADVAYYVHVEGNGVNKLLLTPLTSITIGTNNGINPWDKYNFTIIATTPYEVNTSGNPSTSRANPFGPISSGIIRDNNIDTGDIYETTNRQYGYRIPIGSIWVGRKFNRILFPIMTGGGLLASIFINNAGGIGTSTYPSILNVKIYASAGGAEIGNRDINIDGDTTFNTTYTITFNDITITENMHIIFSSVEGVICMGYNNSSGTIPLQPIKILSNVISDTNIGMLCDFQFV
jgi:hypothetical protein